MFLEFTTQGSRTLVTPRKPRPREFKSPPQRNRNADRTETLVRAFHFSPYPSLTNAKIL
jgi:hypothetical protein